MTNPSPCVAVCVCVWGCTIIQQQRDATMFKQSTRRTDFLRSLAAEADTAATSTPQPTHTPVMPASPGFGGGSGGPRTRGVSASHTPSAAASRTQVQRRMVAGQGGMLSAKGAAAKAAAVSSGGLRSVGSDAALLSASQNLGDNLASSMSFRVRGKKAGAASPFVAAPGPRPMSEESRLKKEIADAYKEMEQSAKMQAFLEAKAAKHRERVEMIEHMEEAAKQDQQRREAARKRRGEELKAKLEVRVYTVCVCVAVCVWLCVCVLEPSACEVGVM